MKIMREFHLSLVMKHLRFVALCWNMLIESGSQRLKEAHVPICSPAKLQVCDALRQVGKTVYALIFKQSVITILTDQNRVDKHIRLSAEEKIKHVFWRICLKNVLYCHSLSFLLFWNSKNISCSVFFPQT
jgi:hypothetical protein